MVTATRRLGHVLSFCDLGEMRIGDVPTFVGQRRSRKPADLGDLPLSP